MKNDEELMKQIIAHNVSLYRCLNKLSKRELGRLSGLEEKQIRRIENKEHMTTIPVLMKIANVFNIDVLELLINLHDPEEEVDND